MEGSGHEHKHNRALARPGAQLAAETQADHQEAGAEDPGHGDVLRLTGECFGLVNGLAQEFGAFDLNELAALTLSGSLPVVERDLYWKPQTVEELQANWRTNQVRN